MSPADPRDRDAAGDAPDAPCTRAARRSPAPGARRIDSERSRSCLLEAAADEFSEKGYAGARVADIAARAGLNKQLISYYFGGKAGLYEELGRRWQERRRTEISPPGTPLADLPERFLRAQSIDPRGIRLKLWQALAGDEETDYAGSGDGIEDIEESRRTGQVADEFDSGALLLMMMGMATAPITLRREARRFTGLDPDSEEFIAFYGEQMRRVLKRIAADEPDEGGAA